MNATSTISPEIRRLVEWSESRFRVPGTNIRFGLDPILGLIPVIGDLFGAVVGFALVGEAWRKGAGLDTVGRMLWNLALDAFVGSVPLVGDLFDFAFKANVENLRLLEERLGERS